MNAGSHSRLRGLKPLFGLALLSLLLLQIDLGAMWSLMRGGRTELLAASIGCFVVALVVFQALRLHVLVADYTGGFRTSWRLFFVGAFFNNLLPSNVGGDAVRLLYLRRMGDGDWAAPLARLMVHRITGIVALLIALLIYAPMRYQRLAGVFSKLGQDRAVAGAGVDAAALGARDWQLWLLLVGALGVVAAGTAIALHRRLGPLRARVAAFLKRFFSALRTIPVPTLGVLSLLTIAFHGMRMVGLHFALWFLGVSIDIFDLVPVLAVTAVVAVLPLSVGGLGLVEGSLGGGLVLFGVPSEAAVAAALLHRVGLLLVALGGGGMYLAERSAGRLAGARDLPGPPG